MRAGVEDVVVRCDVAVLVLVHAHVTLDAALRCVDARRGVLAVITNPCCQYLNLHRSCFGRAPDAVYQDPGILSDKREIRVWVNALPGGPGAVALPDVHPSGSATSSTSSAVSSSSSSSSSSTTSAAALPVSGTALTADHVSRLQALWDSPCQRPSRVQIRALTSELRVAGKHISRWFRDRRAVLHRSANSVPARSSGNNNGTNNKRKRKRGGGNNDDDNAETVGAAESTLRACIRHVLAPTAGALGVAAARTRLDQALAVVNAAGMPCPSMAVAHIGGGGAGDGDGGGAAAAADAADADADADASAAAGVAAAAVPAPTRPEMERRFHARVRSFIGVEAETFAGWPLRIHGTVVRKRVCQHMAFYSLMPLGIGRKDAERAVQRSVQRAKTNGGGGAAVAPGADDVPSLQVSVSLQFMPQQGEQETRLVRAWKRGIKPGDLVEVLGVPGRTSTGQPTVFCWELSVIGRRGPLVL